MLFLNNLGIDVNKKATAADIWRKVVFNWNFEKATKIVRDIFLTTEKYRNGKAAQLAMDLLIKEWRKMKLGNTISWPFSQGKFDDFVQKINKDQDASGINQR